MVSGSDGRDAATRAGWKPAATTPGDEAQSLSFTEEQPSYSSGKGERAAHRFRDGDGAQGIAGVSVVGCGLETGAEKVIGERVPGVQNVGGGRGGQGWAAQAVWNTASNGIPTTIVGIAVIGGAVVADDDTVAILDCTAANALRATSS